LWNAPVIREPRRGLFAIISIFARATSIIICTIYSNIPPIWIIMACTEHGADLFGKVTQRFADLKNVHVTQGSVPEILYQVAPEKIAFLHLDINSAAAEIGALEFLFDRIVPGGVIVLDDYGWLFYRAQKEAEDPFFAARGCRVLELPTGQGMVIK